MNLHQLRFVREAVRQNFNLTEAAKALFTSQPGVSKAIIELEEELGVDIFTRHGKRIRGLTEPGRAVLKAVEVVMQEIETLKSIGREFAAQDSGSFTIATTHTQARYSLPLVVQAFTQRFPKVRLSLLQGNPKQVAEMVLRDQADLAIATEAIASLDGLISVPCYQWEHVVVVPVEHPLLKSKLLGGTVSKSADGKDIYRANAEFVFALARQPAPSDILKMGFNGWTNDEPTNSAPADKRSSRTVITWPVGAPRSFASVENEY